ncbi:MAG: extracellular solute-binding protein [Pseudomonadota bacterium]
MLKTFASTTFIAATLSFGVIGIAETKADGPYDTWIHGSTLIGDVKYPPDFERFDYVNPDAPKEGTARLSANGTFDSFNFVIPRGTPSAGLGLIYDTLMTSSFDEVSADYGLVAEALRYPSDYSQVTYRLRENARWHDGVSVTPEDVIFSLNTLKEHNPSQAFYYRNVVSAEKTGEREVTFTFDEVGNRELPHIVGQLLILPKHYWEGTDGEGNPRDVTSGTLEPPLGSGAYRIGEFSAGRSITYQRVDDYWGKDLPVNIGKNNFEEIRYEYYRDETVELEAFKADEYDWRVESTAKNWATAYEIPSVESGWVELETFPEKGRGLMVGFITNMRREKFADPRIRRAINLAYNYEEMNRTIFFEQYERIDSYFYGTELASNGLPTGLELEILESVRDLVPEEVFTVEYTNPLNTDRREQRTNLRQAIALFEETGYGLQDGKMVDPETGEPFTIEYLLNGPSFERVALRLKENLERIGVELSIRSVDSSQYVNRVRARDFDMIYTGWAQSLSPGNEQRDYFGSESAAREGSRNHGGVENPAVDRLIERIVFAKDRDELIAATRAMDRVLLHNNYIIPGWTQSATRVARWDRFGHPDPLPEYSIGFPTVWWWDDEKAANIAAEKTN